jgi:hypothetical protein
VGKQHLPLRIQIWLLAKCKSHPDANALAVDSVSRYSVVGDTGVAGDSGAAGDSGVAGDSGTSV